MLRLLKPTLLEPVVHGKMSHGNGSPHSATKSSPYLLQLEKACGQQQRPSTGKINLKNHTVANLACKRMTCPGIGLIPHLILTLTLCIAYTLSHVQLFAITWTTACQAPLFMGFSRQEYWSGLPPPGGSSQPRDRTHVSCIGRRILYHCAPWEAQPQVSGTSIIFIVYT